MEGWSNEKLLETIQQATKELQRRLHIHEFVAFSEIPRQHWEDKSEIQLKHMMARHLGPFGNENRMTVHWSIRLIEIRFDSETDYQEAFAHMRKIDSPFTMYASQYHLPCLVPSSY